MHLYSIKQIENQDKLQFELGLKLTNTVKTPQNLDLNILSQILHGAALKNKLILNNESIHKALTNSFKYPLTAELFQLNIELSEKTIDIKLEQFKIPNKGFDNQIGLN